MFILPYFYLFCKSGNHFCGNKQCINIQTGGFCEMFATIPPPQASKPVCTGAKNTFMKKIKKPDKRS